jgi:WD40 repeat protein
LGEKGASSVLFSEKTRQLFICYEWNKDDAFYQWDLDTEKCVYVHHVGKGFWQWLEAISPDGRYLVATRGASSGSAPLSTPPWNTFIFDINKRTVMANLGDLGAIYECRFNQDCSKIWLWTGANLAGPIVFALDGKRITDFSSGDFPKIQDPLLWDVPPSKATLDEYGLYFKDASGNTNLVTKDYLQNNYWRSKDGRIIIASNRDNEIVIWDTKTLREIVRKRITNHHNVGGLVIYDREKDRFLIADPSDHGTTYLRVLMVTKRPAL